jgi:hypothetical protein
MTFEVARRETAERFAESFSLLSYLKQISPDPLMPANNIIKSLRGLWLVSIYGAIERSVNSATEAAIRTISSHQPRSIDCSPPLHTIFHFSKIQPINGCNRRDMFTKSKELLEVSHGDSPLALKDNPLSDNLQNVDANTMNWILALFGAPDMKLDRASAGRINTLRERRNALTHGREGAAQVGASYEITELENVYNAADKVVTAFLEALDQHCTQRGYQRPSLRRPVSRKSRKSTSPA